MKPHPALSSGSLYSAAEFRRRAEAHLGGSPGDFLHYGDYKINPGFEQGLEGMELKDAAVLVPVVDHGDNARVIFTQRTASLRKHSGQIAFPGGKLDRDETAEFAALRETEEEIGLARHFVDVIGHLPPIPVLSGFRITPVLCVVRTGFALSPNPDEVEAVFDAETSPENSFRLSLEKGRLRWHDREGDEARVLRREPEAGFWRRLIAGVIGILPIESQL